MAYALCVQLMRYLQGISSFTQLWGGAMCFRLSAFRRYGVREFWMTNVVDDCSLADRLIRLGARIRLSADAVLMTEARDHDLGVWRHWMDRQILFLKFCIPCQWVLLGVLACLMLLPVLWAVLALLGVLLGKLSFGWLLGVLAYAAAHLKPLARQEQRELTDVTVSRLSADAEMKKINAERSRLKLEKERGTLVPRSEVEEALAARALFFRNEIENFGLRKAGEIIDLVRGDPAMLEAFMDWWRDETADWMDAWSGEREFVVNEEDDGADADAPGEEDA